jgi:ubiquinol-cytochrome c reductase cytochrome b subunit
MPAYGNSLSPSETTALVRFLTTFRGNDLAPAIDASRHMALSGKLPSTKPNGH